jgi:hypothetical protein
MGPLKLDMKMDYALYCLYTVYIYIYTYILHNDYPSWGKCLPPRPRGAVEKVCWMLQRAVCRSWWEKRGLALFQWSGWSQWSGIDHQVWNIRGITERLWHRDILQKCVHDTTRLGMVWWSLQLHSQLLAPLKANTIWVSGVMQTGPWDAFCRFCVEHKSTVAGWQTFDGTAKDTISLQFKGLASCVASFFFPKLWCYVSGGAAISLHPWLLRQMKPSPGNPL